jgi:hypothetical protein
MITSKQHGSYQSKLWQSLNTAYTFTRMNGNSNFRLMQCLRHSCTEMLIITWPSWMTVARRQKWMEASRQEVLCNFTTVMNIRCCTWTVDYRRSLTMQQAYIVIRALQVFQLKYSQIATVAIRWTNRKWQRIPSTGNETQRTFTSTVTFACVVSCYSRRQTHEEINCKREKEAETEVPELR